MIVVFIEFGVKLKISAVISLADQVGSIPNLTLTLPSYSD